MEVLALVFLSLNGGVFSGVASQVILPISSTTTTEPPSTLPPYFLPSDKRNVTTTVGQTAYLHCRVEALGETQQVSWIRKRDLHVLSSGKVVFASDQRFQVIHPEPSKNWTLQIKFPQLRDSGVYECQVNTAPKIYMGFNLNVIDAQAEIQGPKYVKAGSTINLTCTISQPFNQGLVFWYHNEEILDYEGRVSIETTGDAVSTTSFLTVTNAQPKNSGNFTCWPTLARPSSLIINVVLHGEHPAAMQTGCSTTFQLNRSYIFSAVSTFLSTWLLLRRS